MPQLVPPGPLTGIDLNIETPKVPGDPPTSSEVYQAITYRRALELAGGTTLFISFL